MTFYYDYKFTSDFQIIFHLLDMCLHIQKFI